MSEEVRVTDPVTGGMKGQKLEQYSLVDPEWRREAILTWTPPLRRKAAFDLLDFETGWASGRALVESGRALLREVCGGGINVAVSELSKVYGYGSRKYDRGNWRKGYAWSLSIDAAWRHLRVGMDRDEESGLLHAAHYLWHACCLRDFEEMKLGTDDRLFKQLIQPLPVTATQAQFFTVRDLMEADLVRHLAVPHSIMESPR